jgi:methyl-accepting chemotaxis protein
VVLRLGTSSAEIGEVIKVITSIAEQTNLLALNATIEAARAGEAGKGFGVVATEVKDLARRTALSSEKIGRNIATIQSDAQEAVTAIGEITSIIRQINDIQTVVAAAVEEQAATTSEIGRSVGEAATGSDDIARNITGVAEAARSTTQGAAETHRSAEELARLAGALLALVGKFQLIGLDEPAQREEEPSRSADTTIGVLSPGTNDADVPDANFVLERVAAANRRS